jgi:allantoin racemase
MTAVTRRANIEPGSAVRRRLRLALVLPVAEDRVFLEKIQVDYRATDLGVDTSYHFPAHAPAVIETVADAQAAEEGVRDAVVQAVAEGADAVLVTCFSDPGVRAAAIAVDVPVMGEGRPSIAATGANFARFSILSSQSSTIAAKEAMVTELGLADRLQAVVGMDIPVRELTPVRATAVADLIEREAGSGADAVILGCTGLEAGFTAAVRQHVRDRGVAVAVVDPAEIAGRILIAAALSSGAPR